MYAFILAVAALALAAALWYCQVNASAKKPAPPEPDAEQRLRQTLAADPGAIEALVEALRALEAVMAHPELGGPGYLMIQLPMDGGSAVATAQYPNIQEKLYRQIIRRELDREALAAAGIPEVLLSREPVFEAESGGVVLISIPAGEGLPELQEMQASRRERAAVREVLAEALGKRFPELSVRAFGSDILLTPVREKAVTSTDG